MFKAKEEAGHGHAEAGGFEAGGQPELHSKTSPQLITSKEAKGWGCGSVVESVAGVQDSPSNLVGVRATDLPLNRS